MTTEWQRSSRDRDSQEVGLEAAILERVRNSSLVAVARRRECAGLSGLPKRRIGLPREAGGRGASAGGRSVRGTVRGPRRSANAGMSSEKARENRARRKPQGSGGRIVRSGLVGPKARPFRRSRWRHGGDSVTSRSRRRKQDVVRGGLRPVGGGRPARGTEQTVRKRARRTTEKSATGVIGCPYPKPTQVGEARSLRRASDLSLRNSANSPRNFGRRGPGRARGRGHYSGPSDCLPKTQVPAKS